jgi:hypothetical protein
LRTAGPEKLRYTFKLSDIVQILEGKPFLHEFQLEISFKILFSRANEPEKF